jgi:hypothetical protein
VLSPSHTLLLQAENMLQFGSNGVVKTHLAIAITMAMVEHDQPCPFFSATALLRLLQKAKASYELPALAHKPKRYGKRHRRTLKRRLRVYRLQRIEQEMGQMLAVTARKNDAPAAVQAATVNVAVLGLISGGGGLIQTTSG